MPIARMQWWMRPGPRRAWAIAKPPPSSPSRFVAGHADVGEADLAVAVLVVVAEDGQAADDLDAGGVQRHQDHRCCRCGGARGSVLPITITILQRGSPAPVIHHLRPLMTYVVAVALDRVAMFVASERATSGSVIANAERISPSSSGSQPLLLLLGGAEQVQQLHVAGVRRGAVERLGGDSGSGR